jgi:hypothetical protein
MMDLRLLPPPHPSPLPQGGEGMDRTRINSPRPLAGEGLGVRGRSLHTISRSQTHV